MRGHQRLGRVTSTLTKGPKPGCLQKDVKYADRTDYGHENKWWYDRMTDNYSGFCAWSALFLRKWSTIDRALWPKTHKWHGNCGEGG
jgi:hypothetical protein